MTPSFAKPSNRDGSDRHRSSLVEMVRRLLRYKQWADELAFESVAKIPADEVYKTRSTAFGSIVQTLNHVRVVDDIFQHHLVYKQHGYSARITQEVPPLADLRNATRTMNRWFVDTFDAWSESNLEVIVSIDFVGGGAGSMTRGRDRAACR